MRIDQTKCVGCGECQKYCMLECIRIDPESALYNIDENQCVDCGVCLRASVCPVDAISMPPENFLYPRAIRMQFSDPSVQHPNLKAWGRGTEEAKTNDVTGKFGRGEYGLLLEFGRPCTGTTFAEVEKVTMAMRARNIPIIEDNPVYGLLEDPETGRFKPEYVNERVLSAILELNIREEELEDIMSTMLPMLENLDTVVSVGLVTRFESDASLPVVKRLQAMGLTVRPNAKINVGLGRPLID